MYALYPYGYILQKDNAPPHTAFAPQTGWMRTVSA
jgi:hypothetical protein